MMIVLIPLIFMIQKPVVTESVGINSLVGREKMRERGFILKIIVMPTEHPLRDLHSSPLAAEPEVPFLPVRAWRPEPHFPLNERNFNIFMLKEMGSC